MVSSRLVAKVTVDFTRVLTSLSARITVGAPSVIVDVVGVVDVGIFGVDGTSAHV